MKPMIRPFNKLLRAVSTALCILALLSLGSTPSQADPQKAAVTITGVFDFSTYPNVVGTFTTTGALTISGRATMDIGPNENSTIAHCVVVLMPSDGSGTITIHQECEFSTSPPSGQWEIVDATGAYEGLKGNGSLTMPPNTEAMTGYIY